MKGSSNVYQVTSSDKTQITVLACMSASGCYVPPLIVFAGQWFSYNPLEGFEDAVMGRSENGWMASELFKIWLSDVFVKHLNEKVVPRPVVLFVDGHSTHLTMEASDICLENGIVLYCLLEHASHIMQPCDLRLFGPLKEHWKQATRSYSYENIGEAVTKPTFARVFRKAWEKSAVPDNAIKGFRDSGLFPFAPSKVLTTAKMEPSKIFRSVPAATVTSPSEPGQAMSVDSSASLTSYMNDIELTVHIPISTSVDVANDDNLGSPDLPENAISPCVPVEQASTSIQASATSSSNIPQGYSNVSVTSLASSTKTQKQVPPLSRLMLAAYCNFSATIGPGCDAAFPNASTPPVTLNDLPSTSASSSTMGSNFNKSPVFDEILKLPKSKAVKKKTNKPRVILPKAVTSQKFRDILNQKKAEKEKAENEKIKKRMEREKKRKEKEDAARKRQQSKLAKAKAKSLKVKVKQNKKLVLDDDSDDSEEINSQICYTCETAFQMDASDWISCQKCHWKFHLICVPLDEVDFVDNFFECKYC